jgi:hypothetical protein
VVHDDHHEIVPLGLAPPKAEEGEVIETFALPSLPKTTLEASRMSCYLPTGANLAAAIEEERALRKGGRNAIARRMEWAKRKGGPDDVLAFEHALLRMHEASEAGLVSAIAARRFPEHPRIRLSDARTLLNVGRVREAFNLLVGIDPSSFREEGDRKHFHHLYGITLMFLNDPEAALAEFDSCLSFKAGTCEPELLVAICAPLEDHQRVWSAEQAVTRRYIRIIKAADEALARGDEATARRILDCPLIWEANELQSMARLAYAYVWEEEEGAACDRFRKALALLTMCERLDAKNTINQREMPLPRATWSAEQMSAVAENARAWVKNALTLPR